jgi:hypothetical protein
MGRDLVLARVGAGSLHGSWLSGDDPREWDLHLVPFQPVPFASGPDLEVADVIPGPKWTGLREYLRSWDGWRDYDFVWMPDDDIFATKATISAMFDVARVVSLDLFAPALHDASHFAHFSTMRNHSFFGRWTGFVEIMMPAFSRGALEHLLGTPHQTSPMRPCPSDLHAPSVVLIRTVNRKAPGRITTSHQLFGQATPRTRQATG